MPTKPKAKFQPQTRKSKSSIQSLGALPSNLAQRPRRALIMAGLLRLTHLTTVSEAEVQKLPGIGQKTLNQLRRALAALGLTFKPTAIH